MNDLGMNNTALARRMKVSCPYVTKVLSGDVNFSFTTAAKLARALQMDFVPTLKPVGGSATVEDAVLSALVPDLSP